MPAATPRAQADLDVGHHVAWYVSSDEEASFFLARFIRQGLERGERVLLLLDEGEKARVLEAVGTQGIAVARCTARGQLAVRPFDGAPLDVLEEEMRKAIAEEYAGLRVAGEPLWGAKDAESAARLAAVEAGLNGFLHGKSCLAACVYDVRRFDPGVLRSALHSHPLAGVGGEVFENFHYVDAAGAGGDVARAEFQKCLDSLGRHQRIKDALAQATEELERLTEAASKGPHRPAAAAAPVGGAPAMGLTDLLHVLLRLEKQWQQQYMRLTHQMVVQNPELADLFRDMARKEEFHYGKLEDYCRRRLGDPLNAPPPAIVESILRERTPYSLAEVDRLVDTDRKALALALRIEEESVRMYEWALALAGDEDLQKTCRTLLEMEKAQEGELRNAGGATVVLKPRRK